MAQLSFDTLDVFTTTRFAGNPLAVVRVPAGVDVPTDRLQAIAREFNLSETVFLYDAPSAAAAADGRPVWRLRIFLTDAEIPFAGHPTIGAACHAFETLAPGAHVASLICKAGPIDATYHDRVARAQIPHHVHVHTQFQTAVDDVYRLQPGLQGRVRDDAIALVSPVKGLTFLMVELPDLDALARVALSAKPRLRRDDGWDTGFSGSYFYVPTTTTTTTLDDTLTYRTRMIEGAFEDPATGSAACALAAYLSLKAARAPSARFRFLQGVEMGRASEIGVAVRLREGLDAVDAVELSGSAVKVMSGVIDL